MSVVYWTPINNMSKTETLGGNLNSQILFEEPKLFLPQLLAERNYVPYSKCPSFIDNCKNLFVVRCPYDMKFSFDANRKQIISSLDQQTYSSFVAHWLDNKTPKDPFIITVPPSYVFYTEKDVQIEVISSFLLKDTSKNYSIINGEFNIGKWIRPINFTFETFDNHIEFKYGQPLFFIKFKTLDNSKISFERVEYDNEIEKAMSACINVKKHLKNLSLNVLYEKGKSFVDLFKKSKTKKCPFGFGKK